MGLLTDKGFTENMDSRKVFQNTYTWVREQFSCLAISMSYGGQFDNISTHHTTRSEMSILGKSTSPF
jgi:hypothetical protein